MSLLLIHYLRGNLIHQQVTITTTEPQRTKRPKWLMEKLGPDLSANVAVVYLTLHSVIIWYKINVLLRHTKRRNEGLAS